MNKTEKDKRWRASSAFRAMLRKRLIILHVYSEFNVEKVFDVITNNGEDLTQAVITNEPELLKILDKQIMSILLET